MIDLNDLANHLSVTMGQHELVMKTTTGYDCDYSCDSRLYKSEPCKWVGAFDSGTDARAAHRDHVAQELIALLAAWDADD